MGAFLKRTLTHPPEFFKTSKLLVGEFVNLVVTRFPNQPQHVQ